MPLHSLFSWKVCNHFEKLKIKRNILTVNMIMMLWMKHSLDSLSPLKMVLYFPASSPLSYVGWDTRLSSSTLWASGPSVGKSPIWLSLRRPIVQLLSHVQLFVTPWTAAHQASLSITNSQSLPKLMSIKSVMPPTIPSSIIPSPPAFNHSQHQGHFQWVSFSHQVDKVLELQL